MPPRKRRSSRRASRRSRRSRQYRSTEHVEGLIGKYNKRMEDLKKKFSHGTAVFRVPPEEQASLDAIAKDAQREIRMYKLCNPGQKIDSQSWPDRFRHYAKQDFDGECQRRKPMTEEETLNMRAHIEQVLARMASREAQ